MPQTSTGHSHSNCKLKEFSSLVGAEAWNPAALGALIKKQRPPFLVLCGLIKCEDKEASCAGNGSAAKTENDKRFSPSAFFCPQVPQEINASRF
ncbi:hypothetical protein CDAR_585271 [Caerostris darwini]|uniref:Uncharacterized protein n=1 Tax=Caerostris darwini TaxID=1538125 RepID=A0AAV4U3D1_9ARAC|nr:hypothetical protein CDAR_585271 [Caerostris darwini]